MNSTSTILGAGHTPNESIAYRVIIVAVVFSILSFALLCTRLYTKYFVVKKVDLSDYLIIIGFLTSFIYSTLQIAQTWNGVGKHIWDVSLEDLQLFFRLGSLLGATAYNFGTMFIKMSILMFYLQFSAHRRIRVVIYLVIFVTIGYNMTGILCPFYLCTPMRRYWDFSVEGKCYNINAYFVANSAMNAATDVALLVLPIWLLRPLRIPKRQKIGVTLVLMIGSFVTIISIIRLALIPAGLHDSDLTWHYAKNLILIMLEMHVGVICACLPSLKSLVKAYFPSFFDDPSPIRPSFLNTPPRFQSSGEQAQQSMHSSTATEKEIQTLDSSDVLSGAQPPELAHHRVDQGREIDVEHGEVQKPSAISCKS